MRRESISNLRDDIDGGDPVIVREVISDWHRVVGEDIKFLQILCCSVEQDVQVLRLVAFVGECETLAWPS